MKINWYALIGWLLAVAVILGLVFHHPKPVPAPITPPVVVEPPVIEPPPVPEPKTPETKKKPPVIKKKVVERRDTKACKNVPAEAYTHTWAEVRYRALNLGATKGIMKRLAWCMGVKYDGSGR